MPKLKVDGVEVEVPAGATVLQACEEAGKEIPRFCYHDRLSIAGNCRMCLVEIKPGPPKPAASCAMPAGEDMEVFTYSPMVQHARKGVMEMLLINHPLDCPICDQGGECDLQDQAMGYGVSGSRFEENKRAVVDKYMGPLVQTIMTRCIHCTRCVRFMDEIAGVPAIGALGRGEHMEISTLEAGIASELSGNIIDLCPVGALTSKPYAFVARPWELQKTEGVDVMDAVGTNIRIDARGPEVLRVLPRLHEDVNEEWLSDKSRFALDGLRRQRLDKPYVRGADGKLKPSNWDAALRVVADKIKATEPGKMAVIAGDQTDCETMFAAKSLFEGAHLDCRQDGMKIEGSAPRGAYILNAGLAGVEDADRLLLIGADPRVEAAVFNARIRKRWLQGGFKVGVIGQVGDQTYKTEALGDGLDGLHCTRPGVALEVELVDRAGGEARHFEEMAGRELDLPVDLRCRAGRVTPNPHLDTVVDNAVVGHHRVAGDVVVAVVQEKVVVDRVFHEPFEDRHVVFERGVDDHHAFVGDRVADGWCAGEVRAVVGVDPEAHEVAGALRRNRR